VPRWYDYGFSPTPNETQVQSPEDGGVQLRVLTTILGISRGDDGKPDRVEARMRIENLGTTTVQLLTDKLALYSADLQVFGAPEVLPPQVPPVPAGGNTTIDLAFPLPDGRNPEQMNLRGLQLSWTVQYGDQHVTSGASFTRTDWRAPYDDYPRVHVGVGFGTTIH
jgi:hypothetical protein